MRIRAKQIDVLAQPAKDNFVQDMADKLQSDMAWTVEPYSREELEAEIRRAMTHARRYRIDGPTNLDVFCRLWFRIGAGFDEHPRVKHILKNLRKPAQVRLQTLEANITPDEWRDIEIAVRTRPA